MKTEMIPPLCCKIKKRSFSLIAKSILTEIHPEIGSNKVLEIIFVSPDEIRDYNTKYRNVSKSTNVLTFIYSNYDDYIPILASVVLCANIIKRRARLHERAFEDELRHTLIHGILHAAGFDHHRPSERKKMRKAENRYMEKFKSIKLI